MTKPHSKTNFTSATLPKSLTLLSAITLLTYTVLRAYLICMTHDESGSYRIWLDFNIFSCFIDPGCWKTANLHFVYVLLMKGTVGLFGDSELAIRLPSLLGHVIYLFFSWKLLKMWASSSWMLLFGFIILNANPFLLEFFSLARGYGLAMTFMMVSLYYLADFIKNKQRGAAWGMFIGASLAVFSNYTLLNYYATMIAATTIIFLFQYFKKIETDLHAWRHLLIAGAIVSILLAAILYMPITTLSKVGEFEYGATAFWDTFSSSVKRSLYGVKYLHMYHVEVLGGLFVLALTLGLVMAIRKMLKTPEDAKAQFTLAAFLLPLLVSVASIVQHHLLGVNYLVGRTALLFIPLAAIPFYLFFENLLQEKNNWYRRALPVAVTAFCIIHAVRAYQFTHSTEWWYDSNSRAVLQYLNKKTPEGSTMKLGMHWIFQPTSHFYFKSVPFSFCEPLIYEKEYRSDTFYDYYYIRPNGISKINPAYKVEKRFGWTGVLMVRDTT